MDIKNSEYRFSPLVVGLHWLTVVLIIAVYASMELRGLAPKGSEIRGAMKSLHFLLGLSVLAVVVIRIWVRIQAGAKPAIHPPMPSWQAALSDAMHYALYIFILAMPLLGWLTLSAVGKPIVLFGLPVPSLIGADVALSRQLKDIHEALATLGYVLIGLHAAAALLHHYVMHDNTLVRMLPGHRP
ncbi:cytochrome b [Comamonas sp. 4034]|uniref:cytochrome b n=1 Tax=Comamonas sp. 4034 TaxID=3156455 RepID=UPI003D1C24ED